MLSAVTNQPLEPILWMPDFEVGIAGIDAEHASLVALYNDLVHSLQRGASGVMNQGIMRSLLRYLCEHMDREEGYIRLHSFPGADAHIREHRDFGNALQALSTHPPDGEAAEQAARLLRKWILHHILVSDRALFDHVGQSEASTSVPPVSRPAHPRPRRPGGIP